MVPAAHMTTVSSVATRWTAPITCASVGSALASVAGAAVTRVDGGEPVGCGPRRRPRRSAVSPRAASMLLERRLRVADDAERAVLERRRRPWTLIETRRRVGVGEDASRSRW